MKSQQNLGKKHYFVSNGIEEYATSTRSSTIKNNSAAYLARNITNRQKPNMSFRNNVSTPPMYPSQVASPAYKTQLNRRTSQETTTKNDEIFEKLDTLKTEITELKSAQLQKEKSSKFKNIFKRRNEQNDLEEKSEDGNTMNENQQLAQRNNMTKTQQPLRRTNNVSQNRAETRVSRNFGSYSPATKVATNQSIHRPIIDRTNKINRTENVTHQELDSLKNELKLDIRTSQDRIISILNGRGPRKTPTYNATRANNSITQDVSSEFELMPTKQPNILARIFKPKYKLSFRRDEFSGKENIRTNLLSALAPETEYEEKIISEIGDKLNNLQALIFSSDRSFSRYSKVNEKRTLSLRESFAKDLTTHRTSVDERFNSLREVTNGRFEDLINTLQQFKVNVDTNVSSERKQTNKQIDDLISEIQILQKYATQMDDEHKNTFKEQTFSISNLSKELKTLTKEYRNDFSTFLVEYKKDYNKNKDMLNAFNKEITSFEKTMIKNNTQFSKGIVDNNEQFMKKTQNRVSDFEKETARNVVANTKRVNDLTNEWKEHNKVMSTFKTNFTSDVNEFKKGVMTNVSSFKDEVEKTISEHKSHTALEVSEHKSHIALEVEELSKQINDIELNVLTELKKVKSLLLENQITTKEILDLRKDIEKDVSSIESQLDKLATNEPFIEEAETKKPQAKGRKQANESKKSFSIFKSFTKKKPSERKIGKVEKETKENLKDLSSQVSSIEADDSISLESKKELFEKISELNSEIERISISLYNSKGQSSKTNNKKQKNKAYNYGDPNLDTTEKLSILKTDVQDDLVGLKTKVNNIISARKMRKNRNSEIELNVLEDVEKEIDNISLEFTKKDNQKLSAEKIAIVKQRVENIQTLIDNSNQKIEKINSNPLDLQVERELFSNTDLETEVERTTNFQNEIIEIESPPLSKSYITISKNETPFANKIRIYHFLRKLMWFKNLFIKKSTLLVLSKVFSFALMLGLGVFLLLSYWGIIFSNLDYSNSIKSNDMWFQVFIYSSFGISLLFFINIFIQYRTLSKIYNFVHGRKYYSNTHLTKKVFGLLRTSLFLVGIVTIAIILYALVFSSYVSFDFNNHLGLSMLTILVITTFGFSFLSLFIEILIFWRRVPTKKRITFRLFGLINKLLQMSYNSDEWFLTMPLARSKTRDKLILRKASLLLRNFIAIDEIISSESLNKNIELKYFLFETEVLEHGYTASFESFVELIVNKRITDLLAKKTKLAREKQIIGKEKSKIERMAKAKTAKVEKRQLKKQAKLNKQKIRINEIKEETDKVIDKNAKHDEKLKKMSQNIFDSTFKNINLTSDELNNLKLEINSLNSGKYSSPSTKSSLERHLMKLNDEMFKLRNQVHDLNSKKTTIINEQEKNQNELRDNIEHLNNQITVYKKKFLKIEQEWNSLSIKKKNKKLFSFIVSLDELKHEIETKFANVESKILVKLMKQLNSFIEVLESFKK